MALPTPKLDDRSFQQIVDEAKKRIPHYTREWTDHNVSDPGVTLIELFAWMTETILYRVNQVPDLHTVKFLEMLGIKLQAPEPATAPITFWFSGPQESRVIVPAGTEVASTQTETESSIIFTSDANLGVDPPELESVITRKAARESGKKRYSALNMQSLKSGFDGVNVFTDTPQFDDALYFGFKNNLSHHILGFELNFDSAGGAGVNPENPPYVWEASTGDAEDRWETCEVEYDTTKALNSPGRILIHVPRMGLYQVNKDRLYWVRVRIVKLDEAAKEAGVRAYSQSPRIRKIEVQSWGGTVGSTHSQIVRNEFIGRSDGSPGQRFNLGRFPLLRRTDDERLKLTVDNEEDQLWSEVNDFAETGFHDTVYTLDSVTGELRFGPALRQPDGTVKVYGAIPPRGGNLFFNAYRTGGGTVGNVKAGVLNTLKTAIPFIARVSNRSAADGGLDAESLAAAMMRAPQLLRSRERAVTEADYEFLAMQALPAQISRVKCLQPRPVNAGRVQPGRVYVLVIPRIHDPERLLSAEELDLSTEASQLLSSYLDERRLLTVRLSVREPEYRGVAVKVQLRATPGADQDELERRIMAQLHRFLNPLTGGADGKGWPFGRDIYISDVYQCLQGMEGIQFIRNVEMRPSGIAEAGSGDAVEFLEVVAHGVVASGEHDVEFV